MYDGYYKIRYFYNPFFPLTLLKIVKTSNDFDLDHFQAKHRTWKLFHFLFLKVFDFQFQDSKL